MTDHPIATILRTFPTEPLPGLWAWVSPCGYHTIGKFVIDGGAVGLKYDDRYPPQSATAWDDGDYLIRLDGQQVEPRRLGDVPREALERHPAWMMRPPACVTWTTAYSDTLARVRGGMAAGDGYLVYPIRHTDSGVERVPWAEVLA